MYHTIIRHQLRLVFHHLNEKNYEPILKSLAPTFEHTFYGDHALGGNAALAHCNSPLV
jgi:hypothetical protein